jgi:uncharacterized protein (TIGR00251 family)
MNEAPHPANVPLRPANAPGRILLDIKAVPGASKTEFAGVKDDRLRIRVAAAPEDGKANNALIAFLAKTLGCPRRDIILEAGEKSRLKTVSFPAGYGEKIPGGLNRPVFNT